jgi:tetratricopeptide (TPR) repeat protein
MLPMRKFLLSTSVSFACLCMTSLAHAQGLQGEAYQHAAAAYDAIGKNDLTRAESEARKAFALRPDSADAARLLMDVLSRQGQKGAAIDVANKAVSGGSADAELYLARAYLKSETGDITAIADFEQALASGKLPADKAITARIGISDAAARINDPAKVVAALSPASNEMSYDVQGRLGFALFDLNRMDEAAAAFEKAVATARTLPEKNTALKGQAQALANLKQNDRVRTIVAQLSKISAACDLDLVYLQLRIGDDRAALDAFNGVCASSMTAGNELDAAYAAKRLNDNTEAARHFERSLDLDRAAAKPEFDTQKVFALRREVETLNRTFGLNGTLAYRADRPANAGGSGGQAVVEGYWQPPDIGNVAGRTFQLYSRVSLNTLAGGDALQSNSTQGALGARYKPLADTNMVVAAEHLFKIGSGAINDWLLRAGYSAGLNTDIDPIAGTIPVAQLYGEADYLLNQGRSIGVLEGRYGYETQVFASSQNLRASIFMNASANYDSAENRKFAVAAGPGIGLRYWFRESTNRAPASYIQTDVIYRFNATTAKRSGGLVLQISFGF